MNVAECPRHPSAGARKIHRGIDELLRGPLADRPAAGLVVAVKGVYDLLHLGHVRSFELAANIGDTLVVAVSSDAAVRQRKGPNRPIIPAAQRMRLVAAIGCVGWVVPYDQASPYGFLRALRPDVFAASHFASLTPEERAELSRSTVLKTLPKETGTSTSQIVARILSRCSR